MDKVWFPKGLGLSSIGLGFEFHEVHFWEPGALGLEYQGFCNDILKGFSGVVFGFFRISLIYDFAIPVIWVGNPCGAAFISQGIRIEFHRIWV